MCSKNSSLSADTSALEQQIDILVYHLYGLTYLHSNVKKMKKKAVDKAKEEISR